MRSRILVIGFLISLAGALIGLRMYFDEEGEQQMMADVPCAGMLPTVLELQGARIEVGDEKTCELLKLVAAMKPTGEKHHDEPGDPWHYYGRMRILPENDAWFLIFNARGSSGYRPEFSLQHRKGVGWTVIGQFDALPVLDLLGARQRLDTAKLRSPESLTPTDQEAPM